MKNKLPVLLLCVATCLPLLGARADVAFLEPYNLRLGVSTEQDVIARLGSPTRRSLSPDGLLYLHLPSDGPGVSNIQVQLRPDAGNTPRVEQVLITYDQPRDASYLRDHYQLAAPAWKERRLFGGKTCRVEYYEHASISYLQGASVALFYCGKKQNVTTLAYLSPDGYKAMEQQHAATGAAAIDAQRPQKKEGQ